MMRRTWILWTLFALCLAVTLGAMAWISVTAVRLDRVEADAARQAQLEEAVRLALWRMDALLSPLVAQETARPYFAYSAFTPAERAYTRMFSQIQYGDVLVPSPLLTLQSPLIQLHFQIEPDGTLSSPQAPTGNMRDLASQLTTTQRLREASAKLEEFGRLLARDTLLASLPADQVLPATLPSFELNYAADQQQAFAQPVQQAQKSMNELQARNVTKLRQQNYDYLANRAIGAQAQEPSSIRVSEGVMRPMWVGPMLVLARRVAINSQVYVQGCWLNWDAIRTTLLENVHDLLPSAALEPITAEGPTQYARRLTSIPVRLVPGAIAFAPIAPSPVRATLAVAWICVFVGAAAIAVLLWGAILLSQRRAAFVSAVTHELRTPLTTVSMYAEMLQEGMLPDEAKRREYLGTLRAEADRLGHLVENVLAYSRIERGGVNGRIQSISVSEMIENVKDRLATRARQAGMELALDCGGCAQHVRADASAVEQILFNLVDNAGKYARSAEDRRVHLRVRADPSHAIIEVEDHGPGIAASDAARLFRPFSKSARDAANSAPGVGLGLALSRRLAREMGGDLRLDRSATTGARFVLTLKSAS